MKFGPVFTKGALFEKKSQNCKQNRSELCQIETILIVFCEQSAIERYALIISHL